LNCTSIDDTDGVALVAVHPTLNLTPEEDRTFRRLFQLADTENIGVVTGEVAVKFFEKSGLQPRILGEVGDALPVFVKVNADAETPVDLADSRH
jgi:hypothetical protein